MTDLNPADERQRLVDWFTGSSTDVRRDRFITVRNGRNSTYHKDHTNPDAQLPPDSPKLSGNYGIHFGDGLLGVDVDDVEAFHESGAVNELPVHAACAIISAHAEAEVTHYLFTVEDNEAIEDVLDEFDNGSRGKVDTGCCEIAFGNMMFVGPGSQRDGDKCDSGHCNGNCEGPDNGYYEIDNEGTGEPLSPDELRSALSMATDYTTDDDSDVQDGTDGGSPDAGTAEGYEGDGDGSGRPSCYTAALKARADGGTNTNVTGHEVNLQAALLGLSNNGYDIDPVADDFEEFEPPSGYDDDKTRYHLKDTAKKLMDDDDDLDEPPSAGTLHEKGILSEPVCPDDDCRIHDRRSVASQPADDDGSGRFDHRPSADIPVEPAGSGVPWSSARELYADDDTTRGAARGEVRRGIRSQYAFMRPADSGHLWMYDPDTGDYIENARPALESLLQSGLRSFATNNEVRELAHAIERDSYIPRNRLDAGDDDHLLCVGNGVLDTETRSLDDHDPDHCFTSGMPADYDPDAGCPKIDSFLDDITEREEDKLTIYEMIGNCLLPHYDFESFLILVGEGGNGKTTLFDVIGSFLGDDNVANTGLQDLSGRRFARSDLVGKMANLVPDISGTKIDDLGPVKSLTGGDDIRAERKNEGAFRFSNRAKMMFGANRPPVLGEKSGAVKRRLLPIRMPYRFTDDPNDGNPDKRERSELVAELTTDDELSGLLNKALEGIDRLRNNGGFSLPESEDERLERYESFSDPIKMFAQGCVENTTESIVTKDALYDAYVAFCDDENHETKSRNIFSRQLDQTGFSVQTSRKSVNGDRVYVYDGAELTERGEGLCSEQHVTKSREVTAHAHGGSSPGSSGPTELADVDWVDDAPNPDAVTVETIDAELDPSDKKSFEATVRDGSDEVIGVVAWNNNEPATGHLVQGECYLIERPVCGTDHKGRKQIELEGRSVVTTIQHGVGHVGAVDDDDNTTLDEIRDGSTDVETIGGDDEVPDGDVRDAILSETAEPIDRDTLTEYLVDDCGLDRDRVDHRIDTMTTDGVLYVNTNGNIEQR